MRLPGGSPEVDLTDVTRFTGRATSVLTSEGARAVPVKIRALDATDLEDDEILARLTSLVEAMSPNIAWAVTACDSRRAAELAKWCHRRDVFYHHCRDERIFVLARK